MQVLLFEPSVNYLYKAHIPQCPDLDLVTPVSDESVSDHLFLCLNILDLKYLHLLLNIVLWVNPIADKQHTVSLPFCSGTDK